jgi:Lon protease-like protein
MERELPMFPLGTVLFPRASLPLHVFETRYRVMVHDCLRGDREFGVVLIERGSEVGGGDTRFSTGTLARIVHASEVPDGRWALTAVGVRRLRVTRWLPDDPYPRAEVELLEDGDGPGARPAMEARARVGVVLQQAYRAFARVDPRLAGLEIELDPDPGIASFEAAARAPIGPLDAQRVLETPDATTRLRLLAELVTDAITMLEARLGPEGS